MRILFKLLSTVFSLGTTVGQEVSLHPVGREDAIPRLRCGTHGQRGCFGGSRKRRGL